MSVVSISCRCVMCVAWRPFISSSRLVVVVRVSAPSNSSATVGLTSVTEIWHAVFQDVSNTNVNFSFLSQRLALLRRVDAASAWVRAEKELGTEALAHLHVAWARNKLCYFRYWEFQDVCYLNLTHLTVSATKRQEDVIMSKHIADCKMREWDWVHKSSKLGAMSARQTETNNLQHLSLLTHDEEHKGAEWDWSRLEPCVWVLVPADWASSVDRQCWFPWMVYSLIL